jgi:hypothetical protein
MRKDLEAASGISYAKIYKLEWEFKTNSQIFQEVIHTYPDAEQMKRAINAFESWNRSKTHKRAHELFRTVKV